MGWFLHKIRTTLWTWFYYVFMRLFLIDSGRDAPLKGGSKFRSEAEGLF